MRLNIGLVYRLSRIAALDDDIGFLEARLGVAFVEIHPLGHIRRLGRLGLEVRREQVLVQDRCIVRHRCLDVDDVGEHLVLDVDQVQRRVADCLRDGRNRSNRVTLIQCLVARHAVAREVAEVHRPFANERLFRRDIGKVGGGDDGAHARQLQRLARVDRHDARMRVR